jgi:hypothetical protein
LWFRNGIEVKKLSNIRSGASTMSEKSKVTRRTTAEIGVAAAPSAFAKGNSEMEAQELQNPVDKYPKPPYKKQSQPWPGLASQMDPRPDRGEKSYRGSGRLAGRKALITGGDTGMGRAAAIAYAREGADVAINYFSTEEPDAKEVIDLRDEKFCQELVARAILAKQLAPKGVRVNAVEPGPIWTPLQVSGGATMEKLEKFGGQTPIGRAGQPAELGSIYVQLAVADASFATGQVYGSAGGSGQP